MKRYILLICLLNTTLLSFTQESKFSSFELIYDIPQQISKQNDWPKYYLNSMNFYNDTLFTLLVTEGHLTSIPLSDKTRNIQNEYINFPPANIPLNIARHNNRWYYLTNNNEFGYFKDKHFICLIRGENKRYLDNFFFLENRILIHETNSMGEEIRMYNLNGNLISSSKTGLYLLMNAGTYKNEIINISNRIVIENDSIRISENHDYTNYGNENVFVGTCKNYGFFIDWDNRDHIIIRDMDDLSKKEIFKFPKVFKQEYMGIPPEGETTINLRVFSEDNNTFYFVTLKYGHLVIYKATR